MRLRDIVLIAILSATLTAAKLALSFIPNVEIVTLLLIIFALVLGVKRTLFISIIFVCTEILIYGFSTWVLGYFLVWPLLVIITGTLKSFVTNEYGYALIAGVFGLCFGFFFAITESFFYGVTYGISYWISGLSFDIVHGVSNFILTLVLFKPLYKVFSTQILKYDSSN